ncbi:hypothetical protein [Thermoflexibacter ruber]|uniref:Uncharacterized protein n=1 Tax=Thermoflexibacter ruber TaxID=1003 RepID=A0A1I2GZY7_9BACT|nr:hypothetical protein [Thermoflexibacter ruber]SFF22972.1 hypothetical protein SAMN04488541_102112 [Thermoflexibacter ruber]
MYLAQIQIKKIIDALKNGQTFARRGRVGFGLAYADNLFEFIEFDEAMSYSQVYSEEDFMVFLQKLNISQDDWRFLLEDLGIDL